VSWLDDQVIDRCADVAGLRKRTRCGKDLDVKERM
jgi:hypothetical protein